MPLKIILHFLSLLGVIFIDKTPNKIPIGQIKGVNIKAIPSNFWYGVISKNQFSMSINIIKGIMKEIILNAFPVFLMKDLYFIILASLLVIFNF